VIVLFNLIIIGLVVLIAYWWSNEGAFSALLHLVCVIAAGTIALAVWEPLLFGLISLEGAFAGLLPGVVLLGVFIIALLILRKATDLIAPEAALLPDAANAIVGGLFGAGSGVLTVGLLLVGTGFIHQPLELLGYRGWSRQSNDAKQQGMVEPPAEGLWLPAGRLTMDFFEFVSTTTFRPDLPGSHPLAWANPDLDQLATLVRDTIHDDDTGELGATVMPPGSVKMGSSDRADAIDKNGNVLTGDFLLVTLTIDSHGKDFRGGLRLSSSQLRVIGFLNGKTVTYHPTGWGQLAEQDEGIGYVFRAFDADDKYATSPSGRGDTNLRLLFAVPDDFDPRFLQIRGSRFPLRVSPEKKKLARLLEVLGAEDVVEDDIHFGGDITRLVQTYNQGARFSQRFKPSTQDIKQIGGEILQDERRLVSINANIKPNRGDNPRGELAMRGYYTEPGAALVRIQCHPNTPGDLFTAARKFRLSSSAEIQLLDVNNEQWYPIGYELIQPNRITLMYRDKDIETLGDILTRPRAGSSDQFFLLFEVPEGTQLSELRLDEDTMGIISGITAERYRGR